MTAAPCPFTELWERDLGGPELSHEEQDRLEHHLAQGCATCETRIEAHLTESDLARVPLAAGAGGGAPGSLDAMVAGALLHAEEAMAPARPAVLERVSETLKREDAQRRTRLRRRHLRVIFYLTNLAAAFLLVASYVGMRVALRIPQRAAQLLATRTEVTALVAALSRYVRDHPGPLPQDGPALVQALSTPRAPGAPPYFPFDAGRRVEAGYADDFGRPYGYRASAGRALIYSLGPDGRDDGGEGDDVGTWVYFAQ